LVVSAATLRTTPGPKSNKYGVSSTKTRYADPILSGLGFGVPEPKTKKCVEACKFILRKSANKNFISQK
jgi:hypothetical protein